MIVNKALTSLGKFFEATYKLPLVGDFAVRRITRGMASMTFHNPLSSMKKCASIQDVKQELQKMAEKANGELLISKEDETSFEYLSSPCPYGFNRKDQAGVCDAVMDLNRRLFDLCGARLTIHERMASGAPRCRITMEMKDKV